jgi:hypothetical protein
VPINPSLPSPSLLPAPTSMPELAAGPHLHLKATVDPSPVSPALPSTQPPPRCPLPLAAAVSGCFHKPRRTPVPRRLHRVSLPPGRAPSRPLSLCKKLLQNKDENRNEKEER